MNGSPDTTEPGDLRCRRFQRTAGRGGCCGALFCVVARSVVLESPQRKFVNRSRREWSPGRPRSWRTARAPARSATSPSNAAPRAVSPVSDSMSRRAIGEDGAEQRLRRKPFAILKLSGTHPKHLVTQDEPHRGGLGQGRDERKLAPQHMRDLRQVIGDSIVQTVWVGLSLRRRRSRARRARRPTVQRRQPRGVIARRRDDELAALRGALEPRSIATSAGVVTVKLHRKTALVDALLVHAAACGRCPAGCARQTVARGLSTVLGALVALCAGRAATSRRDLAHQAPSWLIQLPGVMPMTALAALQVARKAHASSECSRELADALETS